MCGCGSPRHDDEVSSLTVALSCSIALNPGCLTFVICCRGVQELTLRYQGEFALLQGWDEVPSEDLAASQANTADEYDGVQVALLLANRRMC